MLTCSKLFSEFFQYMAWKEGTTSMQCSFLNFCMKVITSFTLHYPAFFFGLFETHLAPRKLLALSCLSVSLLVFVSLSKVGQRGLVRASSCAGQSASIFLYQLSPCLPATLWHTSFPFLAFNARIIKSSCIDVCLSCSTYVKVVWKISRQFSDSGESLYPFQPVMSDL